MTVTITDWAQAISMVVLVIVTGIYVWRTHIISKATKEQADASVEMAEEMREQRIMTSRPVIIQKAVVETETEYRTHDSKDWFSYFDIYNAGNGPTIELEVSLLNKNKELFVSHRVTCLKAGDKPIHWPHPLDSEFPVDLSRNDESLYYLVSEYQGIFSAGSARRWYQTWLPFETIKTSKDGEIFVKQGELEFKEITEKERIDAFGSGSKPR